MIALQNFEAICAVDDVDGVFIDLVDPVASTDHHGNTGHPKVQATIDNAMRTITVSGKAAGTLISDPMLAYHYLKLGCILVATGIDILLFTNGARKLTRDFIAPQTA